MTTYATKHAQCPRIFVVNDPHPLRICNQLAEEIGFNESIVLLMLEELIASSNTEQHDGLYWTYQGLADLHSHFPWWSRETINRAIHSLECMELILVGNYNRRKADRTRWFALNSTGISKLKSVRLSQNEPPISQNEPPISQNEPPISQNEPPISQNETPISQNETTLPLVVLKESLTTTTNDDSEKSKPVAVDGEGDWNLDLLLHANAVSRKKAGSLRTSGITGRAFASWVVYAFSSENAKDPVAIAITAALDHPSGANNFATKLTAMPYADAIELLAKAIAGYPVRHGALSKLSTAKLRDLFAALGGDDDDIPERYEPRAVAEAAAPALTDDEREKIRRETEELRKQVENELGIGTRGQK